MPDEQTITMPITVTRTEDGFFFTFDEEVTEETKWIGPYETEEQAMEAVKEIIQTSYEKALKALIEGVS